MNGEHRFYGDNLDSVVGSLSSDEGAPTDGSSSLIGNYLNGLNGGSRFDGDNMDSHVESDSSADQRLTGINWDEDHMSHPSTPLTDIIIPDTPDTVGDYPNVITMSLTGGPKPTQETCPPVEKGSPHRITFELGNFPSDQDLMQVYPKESDLRFAMMARDLNLVCNHHILRITGSRSFVKPEILSISADPILCRQSIPLTMGAVISQLSCLQEMAATNLETITGHSIATTTNDTSPWLYLPLNRKGVYLSKLLSTYMGQSPCVRFEQTEIADYCIASHDMMDPRELLFNDGDQVQVERAQMVSMEQGEICNPAIVRAWGRILKDRRKGIDYPIVACLDIVDKGESVGADEGIVDRWLLWLALCDIDMHAADLVLIPVAMRNHYTLLAINFRDNTIQSIDGVSHTDQHAWDVMACAVVAKVGVLLDLINHAHSTEIHSYKHQLINPKWSTSDERTDSAIEVMHLMEAYDGNPSSIANMRLDEDHVRVELTIAYVSDIVTSEVSVCRQLALAKLPGFIEDKSNNVLRPTREIVQYRQVCGWLADV